MEYTPTNQQHSKTKIYQDPEFWFILVYNLVVLYLYTVDKVDPYFVVWAFYLQSLLVGAEYVIGSFIFRRKKRQAQGPGQGRSFTWFFILHYGLFHFVYFIFLVVMSAKSSDVIELYRYVRLTMGYLLVNLIVYSVTFSSKRLEELEEPNGFLPYLRILPIHLFIIVGFNTHFFFNGFTVFIVLKILSDLVLFALLRPKRKKIG